MFCPLKERKGIINHHAIHRCWQASECKSDIRPLANQKLHLIAQLAHFLS